MRLSSLLAVAALLQMSIAATTKVCGLRELYIPLFGTQKALLTVLIDPSGDFQFRVDGDLHVTWCGQNRADLKRGQILEASPCLLAVLEKYHLTDFAIDVDSYQKFSLF